MSRDKEIKNALGKVALYADLLGEMALQSYLAVLRPILEALENDNDEFFSDLAIAIRREKNQPTAGVDYVLANYSLLTLGKRPLLTFRELNKTLHWIEPADLRKRIRTLRKRYGEWVVPLKLVKPGASRRYTDVHLNKGK